MLSSLWWWYHTAVLISRRLSSIPCMNWRRPVIPSVIVSLCRVIRHRFWRHWATATSNGCTGVGGPAIWHRPRGWRTEFTISHSCGTSCHSIGTDSLNWLTWILLQRTGNISQPHNKTKNNDTSWSTCSMTKTTKTSSSVTTERLHCRVGQFWPKVEDDILQTLQVYLQALWYNRPAKLSNSMK